MASYVQFADTARRVADRARALGLVVPAFRSPPRVAGADRTLRRRADGGSVVAVRVHGRAPAAVVADLVEGVVAANGLSGEDAAAVRAALQTAAGGEEVAAA